MNEKKIILASTNVVIRESNFTPENEGMPVYELEGICQKCFGTYRIKRRTTKVQAREGVEFMRPEGKEAAIKTIENLMEVLHERDDHCHGPFKYKEI